MADRRQQIVETSYNLVGTKGLESLHARTVAAELAINHATVHYYFKTRQDLLEAVAEYTHQRVQADRAKFHEGATKPAQKLEQEIALWEAYSKPKSRLVKVLAALYTAGLEYPSVRKQAANVFTDLVAVLEECVGKGSGLKDARLLAANLFGIALSSHIAGSAMDSGALFDALFAEIA